MFLSMVAAPTDRKGEEVRIGALTKESDKRRFNVAASRARDQVWLFHTATLNDLNPQDMRAKLLSYYLNPQHSIISEPDWSRCGSDFERDVGRQIYSRGYRIIPQYEPFGSTGYRIDFVIEGTKNRLAIECDGDYWHGPEQFEHDMRRQCQLERCGSVFWRLRGSEYYRKPEKALEPLWKRLAEMGIHPPGSLPGPSIEMRSAPLIATEEQPYSSEPIESDIDNPEIAETTRRSITAIPQEDIQSAVKAALPRTGKIERELFLREAARILDFSRLGPKIIIRLNRAIGAEIRAARIKTDDNTIWRHLDKTPETELFKEPEKPAIGQEPLPFDGSDKFAPGKRVYHPAFGEGVVLDITGDATNSKITIVFRDGRPKTLDLNIARNVGLKCF